MIYRFFGKKSHSCCQTIIFVPEKILIKNVNDLWGRILYYGESWQWWLWCAVGCVICSLQVLNFFFLKYSCVIIVSTCWEIYIFPLFRCNSTVSDIYYISSYKKSLLCLVEWVRLTLMAVYRRQTSESLIWLCSVAERKDVISLFCK